MATTNRSRILLRAGVPAVLAVVGATILYRHVDASSVASFLSSLRSGPSTPGRTENTENIR